MGLKSSDQDCQTAEEIQFWDDLNGPSQKKFNLYEDADHEGLKNYVQEMYFPSSSLRQTYGKPL